MLDPKSVNSTNEPASNTHSGMRINCYDDQNNITTPVTIHGDVPILNDTARKPIHHAIADHNSVELSDIRKLLGANISRRPSVDSTNTCISISELNNVINRDTISHYNQVHDRTVNSKIMASHNINTTRQHSIDDSVESSRARNLRIQREDRTYNDKWESCCLTIDRRAALFFTQLSLGLITIIFSMVKLIYAAPNENTNVWVAMLTGTTAWFFPAPSMDKKE